MRYTREQILEMTEEDILALPEENRFPILLMAFREVKSILDNSGVLYGKDAKNFSEKLNNPDPFTPPISKIDLVGLKELISDIRNKIDV